MEKFAISVKSFIVNDDKLLLIRRRENDVHKPGIWEIIGGRLESGEDPYAGLKRETIEEVGLEIDILAPLDVHHFLREDGQLITMIVFLCHPKGDSLKLSEEHVEYEWVPLRQCKERLYPAYHRTVDKYFKFGFNKL